jgi:hypothetical protein
MAYDPAMVHARAHELLEELEKGASKETLRKIRNAVIGNKVCSAAGAGKSPRVHYKINSLGRGLLLCLSLHWLQAKKKIYAQALPALLALLRDKVGVQSSSAQALPWPFLPSFLTYPVPVLVGMLRTHYTQCCAVLCARTLLELLTFTAAPYLPRILPSLGYCALAGTHPLNP